MADRALKPLHELPHYPIALADRVLIMAPNGTGGASSAIELRRLAQVGTSIDVDAIADVICRHLNGQNA